MKMPGDFSSVKVAADEGSVCPEHERDWLGFSFRVLNIAARCSRRRRGWKIVLFHFFRFCFPIKGVFK
jgi:hypothetical protein